MSRNARHDAEQPKAEVTSREGRVSRNISLFGMSCFYNVTSREGRVSRNVKSGIL